MIGLGLRLTLNGGREAAVRLVITTVAVAIGVGMLLIMLAGTNALSAQSGRGGWHEPGRAAGTRGPLIWVNSIDEYQGQLIDRVDVAVTGRGAPVPPGLARLPGPGQFYASPALTRLLRDTPADELRDRFGRRQAGVIGPVALATPNSLLVVVGRRPAQLVRAPGAARVSRVVAGASPLGPVTGPSTAALEVVLAVAGLALVVPVLMFISTATRLSAARREQRFAAMRLVGATLRQVSVVAAVEASLSAALGTAAGFGLFCLIRVPAAGIPFTGQPFFPSQMTLRPADILAVAIGVPLLAALVARIALRRVQISPLGVSRRTRPAPPRWWRILPLAAGVAELSYFAAAGHPRTVGQQLLAFFGGFLLTIAGLITAGPWLTMAGSRLLARRAVRPAALIAGRRLADQPRVAFRAVSGLILALFVTSVAVGVITTLSVDEGGPDGARAGARSTLIDPFAGGYHDASGQPAGTAARISPSVRAQLRAITGVVSVTVHRAPGVAPGGSNPLVSGIIVDTDGLPAAIERARTVLEIAQPYLGLPQTPAETHARSQAKIVQYQHDADVLILASLPIAGCSLAVSVAAGLTERRRPFSLLRLTGVPLSTLRRVVALESVVPLILVAVASAGAGLLAAELFVRAQFGVTLISPGPLYYLSVLAGLVLSLAVIAATLPLLNRITGPEAARDA